MNTLALALPHITLEDVLSKTMVRLALAALLGAIIGLERELKRKPAGLRTNIFICFGSAMFTILSAELAKALRHRRPHAHCRANHSRHWIHWRRLHPA